MKLVICTVGISIARGCSLLSRFQQKVLSWSEDCSELAAEIQSRLSSVDFLDELQIRAASAELNSLHRLGLSSSDKIILLASDTADGRCCAEQLKQIIPKMSPIADNGIEVKRIEGLQVRDGKRFREQGVPNLIQAVMSYREQYNPDQIILNSTGGFKGVVPFLTVLGMIFRFKTVYLFEFSEEMISLPPLPLSFDGGILDRALPALDLLRQEGAVPEALFWTHVADYKEHEREFFLPLIECDFNGYVTISPLIEPFTSASCLHPCRVFVSQKISKEISSAQGTDRDRMNRLLSVLSVPLWRTMHSHRFSGTDLSVFKPGNVPERAACIIEKGEVYVCGLYLSHDKYERELSGLQRKSFNLADFIPYEILSLNEVETEGEILLREKKRVAELEEELRRLQKSLNEYSKERQAKQDRRKSIEQRCINNNRTKKAKKQKSRIQ